MVLRSGQSSLPRMSETRGRSNGEGAVGRRPPSPDVTPLFSTQGKQPCWGGGGDYDDGSNDSMIVMAVLYDNSNNNGCLFQDTCHVCGEWQCRVSIVLRVEYLLQQQAIWQGTRGALYDAKCLAENVISSMGSAAGRLLAGWHSD